MDSDTVDFKHKCSDFNTNGDYCSRCKSAFSMTGFRQVLGSREGFLHYDLATLKETEDGSCPLCRVILGRLRGSRLFRRDFREDSVQVVIRIIAQPKPDSADPLHVLSLSLYSTEFADVVQDIHYKLDIFVHQDDAAASWINSRPPELDVTSTSTIQNAKAAISACQLHHVDCSGPRLSKLPRRVIAVESASSPTVHLQVNDQDSELGEYITLSYCWGGDQPISAQSHTLDRLKMGIEVDALPQTLRDAVKTTRDLGYQYLWVDALCIIQDDIHDKTREISAMADIYRGSTATIMAATSRSVDEGYLKNTRKLPRFITVPVELPTGTIGYIAIGHPCPWASFGWSLDPISRRGWTLQEFLLARRILYYGPYELLFHCQQLGFAPLSPSYIHYPRHDSPSSKELLCSLDRAEPWAELIRQYTYRTLTIYDDRPRAMVGIIEALERTWGDKCVFGCWLASFLEHMTWYNVAGFHLHPSLRRSNRAPSWSWLSTDGHVAICCRTKLQADCIVISNPLDVYGGQNLKLSCKLVPQHEWSSLETKFVSIYWDIEQSDESGGEDCFYLYLGSESPFSTEQWFYAFALIVVKERTNVFRRIGIVKIHSRDVEIVRRLESRLPTARTISLL